MQFQGQVIKPLYLRILGMLGMAGAPWILVDFIENGLYDRFRETRSSGLHNLLFMTGCMCSVLALYYLKATGNTKVGKTILIIQLILLAVANCWSIYEIIDPASPSPLYYWLGNSWPLDCIFLIVTGIFILRARRITGWRAVLPLLAGFWFPFMFFISLFFQNSLPALLLSGIYSAVVFLAWGFSIFTLPDLQPKR